MHSYFGVPVLILSFVHVWKWLINKIQSVRQHTVYSKNGTLTINWFPKIVVNVKNVKVAFL